MAAKYRIEKFRGCRAYSLKVPAIRLELYVEDYIYICECTLYSNIIPIHCASIVTVISKSNVYLG
jgi:hypothetical protein